MDKETYCAYNTTRDCFLSSEVTLIDTARDPLGVLKVLVEGLAVGAETGLWLTSLTTMPMVPRISPFDVVYLDKNQQVTNLAELLPGFEFPVFESPSVSALVLPLHTILATQTCRGDRLRICIDTEMPGLPVRAPSVARPFSAISNLSDEEAPVRGGFPGGHSDEEPLVFGKVETSVAPQLELPISGMGWCKAEQNGTWKEADSPAPEIPSNHENGNGSALREGAVSASSSSNGHSAEESWGELEPGSKAPGSNGYSRSPVVQGPDPFVLPENRSGFTVSQSSTWRAPETEGTPPATLADIGIPQQMRSVFTDARTAVSSEKISQTTQALKKADQSAGFQAIPAEVSSSQPAAKPNAEEPKETSRVFQQRIEHLTEVTAATSLVSEPTPQDKKQTTLQRTDADQSIREAREASASKKPSLQARLRGWLRPPRVSIPPMAEVATGLSRAATKESLRAQLKRWLEPDALSSDRRRSDRRQMPSLVAYYWTGGSPKAHRVADISETGFYLVTEDRWVVETMIQMTLQKSGANGQRKVSMSVLTKVIRNGKDGVGTEFVMSESLDLHSREMLGARGTDRRILGRFLQ